MTVEIALLGFGRWGENLARVATQSPLCRLVAIVDPDAARRSVAKKLYPDIMVFAGANSSYFGAMAVIVATPPLVLAQNARDALLAGCHVLAEKPGATTSAGLMQLAHLAKHCGLQLMIDLTPVYSSLSDHMRDSIRTGEIGQPRLWHAQRINTGIDQPGIDVLRDLAIHDLAVLDATFGLDPETVSIADTRFGPDGRLRAALLRLGFHNGLRAEIRANWDGPRRLRTLVASGPPGCLQRDDVAGTLCRLHPNGSVVQFDICQKEPLQRMFDSFVAALTGQPEDGASVLRAARQLALIERLEKQLPENAGRGDRERRQ